MGKLLRRNNKVVAHVHFYQTINPQAKGPFKVVTNPRVTKLPKTATKGFVRFYDKRGVPISKGVTLKASTINKMDLV